MQSGVQNSAPPQPNPYAHSSLASLPSIGKYRPPIVYFAAETAVLGIAAWRNDSMRDPESATFYAFWIFTAVTSLLYMLAACSSPGYVTGPYFSSPDRAQDAAVLIRLKTHMRIGEGEEGRDGGRGVEETLSGAELGECGYFRGTAGLVPKPAGRARTIACSFPRPHSYRM